MSDIKNYRDLIVWQKSVQLSVKIYQLTAKFPKEEIFGISSQMRRAGVSIPSYIAEGRGRNTVGEFINFLGIAKGALDELDTQIEISFLLGFLVENDKDDIFNMINSIAKMLNGLKISLKRPKTSNPNT